MEFMSEEHVRVMNARLADAASVRAACSQLPHPHIVGYRLLAGPHGRTVHWTVSFADTVQFSLTAHPTPDVVVITDWRDTMASAAAERRGTKHIPTIEYEGDPSVLLITESALTAAKAVATVPTELPAWSSV